MAKGTMNWGRINRERRMWDRGVTNVADEKEHFERDRAARWLNRPEPTKPKRQRPYEAKGRNGKTIMIPGDGDPCPRCGVPTQIREHDGIGDKQLRQPFYYTRWFCCMNQSCKTTQVMPERHKVMNSLVPGDTRPDSAPISVPGQTRAPPSSARPDVADTRPPLRRHRERLDQTALRRRLPPRQRR
jgi:hypothetical protein